MKKYVLLLSCIVLISLPHYAGAWGKKGHQMVAEIGYGMLDENTQKTISRYLGDITVPNAGTWMDDKRNDPKYAYMKPWHFINMDAGERYRHTEDHNIVNELNHAIEQLRHKQNLTDAEIQLNLLVLFHLIGDIAQPLHVGYGSDRGGNSVDVTYISKPSNLHKVWDSEIIESEGITAGDCQALYSTLTYEQIDVIREIDPVYWMKGSRKLLARVYNFKSERIDNAYVKRNKTVIKKQILYAGMRLAATLEELFKEPAKARSFSRRAGTRTHGADTMTLEHTWFTSHFVNSAHIPWVVEYTLRADQVNCTEPIKRSNKFAADPLNKAATNINKDYVGSGYDRGHCMPAADNGCKGPQAMAECFYFSNMVPQTHRLNAGVWKSLEMQERDMAADHDSIYVWIGSYGVDKTIGANKVVVPEYCWKVIYDYKTREWSAYLFPNTLDVSGKPANFKTTVADIRAKSGFYFK